MSMESKRTPRSKGMTLIELLVSMAASTVLVSGLYIAISLVSNATRIGTHPLSAASGIQRLAIELNTATSFHERTQHSVEFDVDDRDGDGQPEHFRYSWSGTSGDPLMLQVNDLAPAAIVPQVDNFELDYQFRPASNHIPRVLLVVPNASSLSTQDEAKHAWFKAWGFPVQRISAAEPASSFRTAETICDVAYISEEIYSYDLNTKLRDSSLGIVNEEGFLYDDFGVASGSSAYWTTTVAVADPNHPITAPIGTLYVPMSLWNQQLTLGTGSIAPDVVSLMRSVGGSPYVMMAIEKGGELLDGNLATGRRVMPPWGSDSADFRSLTSQAHDLLERSIRWAAGDVLVSVHIKLRPTDDVRSEMVTRVEVLNRPLVSGR